MTEFARFPSFSRLSAPVQVVSTGATESRSPQDAVELPDRMNSVLVAIGGRLPITVVFDAVFDRERSEERRVGKECRYRWAGYDYKKNEGEVLVQVMGDANSQSEE